MKFMDPQEFSEWAAKHTPAEVADAAIEQNALLREDLLNEGGHTEEEFLNAGTDAQRMLLEEGAQVVVDEQKEKEEAEKAEDLRIYANCERNDAAGQLQIQLEFSARHPLHFPCEANTQLFESRYVAAFTEANPEDLVLFWYPELMDQVYAEMAKNNEFTFTRSRVVRKKENQNV